MPRRKTLYNEKEMDGFCKMADQNKVYNNF